MTNNGAQAQTSSKRDSLEALLPSAVDTGRVIILNKLSFDYMMRGSYDTAMRYADMAFEQSEKIHYMKGHARSLINKGNVFLQRIEYDEAKKRYLEALEIGRRIDSDLIISYSVNNLGEVFRAQGNYPEALQYYLEGLRIDEKSGNKSELGVPLNNIGILYNEIGDYKKSIEYLSRALTISRELNDFYYISSNLINLAELYYVLGEFDNALRDFSESLKINESLKDEEGRSKCLLGIGNVYGAKKNFDMALDYYFKSLEIARAIEHPSVIGSCLNNIGEVYSMKKQPAKAIEFQLKYLEIVAQRGIKKEVSMAHYNLSEAYAATGDFKNAYGHRKLFAVMNDSLFNEQKSRQIAEMETRYESENKQLVIDGLEKEHAFQKQINLNQKLIFGGTLALALAVGMVFYFRAQVSKQKNVLLTERVDAQNRELSTIALLVSKKNQAFNDLKERLSEAKNNPQGFQTSVHSIIKDIDQEINFDSEWDAFKYHFEKVHPDFFTKLKTAAPTLGDKELRFCAYVKGNLTTKEIARLTNTTVRSVQQTKYRINQKLLENGGLAEFLLKI